MYWRRCPRSGSPSRRYARTCRSTASRWPPSGSRGRSAVAAGWLPRRPRPAPAAPEPKTPPARRARPSWPGGRAGRRIAAQAYRSAQLAGQDPVLAVMDATGRSRRGSLRLIASARDEGHLSPRHNRR
ncbi:DUF6214 family protein [Streptomyces agglomeratus]|uniref:DUF6214 family protein n=1 Tax=Streptomyces agglomeratus TaxID=285458 RepID=UPI0030B89B7B